MKYEIKYMKYENKKNNHENKKYNFDKKDPQGNSVQISLLDIMK